MIETTARVISIQNGTAQIDPTTTSGCGGCKSRNSCGVSGLGKYFSNNRQAIEVRCDSNIHEGDELLVSMSEGDLLKAGLLVYLLPAVLALVGAGIASSMGYGDAGAVLGMGVGFVTGILLAKLSGWTPHLETHKVELQVKE
jgi:sigma-E factor negative regulatory protein RseC